MKRLLAIISLGFFIVTLQGCLTLESKEYSFKIKKDKSGSGKIKYINVMSDSKDSLDQVETDYNDLIESYLHGRRLEDELQGIKNVEKKLFEEDNQLCGEISFEFEDITKLKFYKYKEDGPWCYYISNFNFSSGTESFFSSNGTYGGEHMPVIFWDGTQSEFKFKTTVTQPAKNTVSLLSHWINKGEK
jgi:hypothetical protein